MNLSVLTKGLVLHVHFNSYILEEISFVLYIRELSLIQRFRASELTLRNHICHVCMCVHMHFTGGKVCDVHQILKEVRDPIIMYNELFAYRMNFRSIWRTSAPLEPDGQEGFLGTSPSLWIAPWHRLGLFLQGNNYRLQLNYVSGL